MVVQQSRCPNLQFPHGGTLSRCRDEVESAPGRAANKAVRFIAFVVPNPAVAAQVMALVTPGSARPHQYRLPAVLGVTRDHPPTRGPLHEEADRGVVEAQTWRA